MRLINWLRLLVVPLLLTTVSGAQAMELKGLYEAQLPVKSQSREERVEVYPAALTQVIVRLTGSRDVVERPELAGVIARARSIVQRFLYVPLPDQGRPVLEEEGYTRQLVVTFDGEALTRELVKAGVALWGRTRPETLVWLAVEDRGARYLLAANASAELESYINGVAERRGVPLILPLMDLEDQARIGFVDVWGNFSNTITEASERYGVDAVLVGRLFRPAQGAWTSRWTLHEGGVAVHWQLDGLDQGDVISGGLDTLSDRLARRYAQVLSPDAADSVLLAVSDINDFSAYARTLRYLDSLDSVSRVQVSEVFGDSVLFRLDVRGELEGLRRAIKLGSTLRPWSDDVGNGTDRVTDSQSFFSGMAYRLLP